MLFRLWVRVLFDYGASHSFIDASCVEALGLEVKTLENSLYVHSLLGTRVSVDQICRDCELEISGILLTMDLRVMNMLEFDVILGMDWLTAHRVVIDCDRRRVCETPRKPNFLKKGKMVISIKIRNFSRSWMMKSTLPFESSREI